MKRLPWIILHELKHWESSLGAEKQMRRRELSQLIARRLRDDSVPAPTFLRLVEIQLRLITRKRGEEAQPEPEVRPPTVDEIVKELEKKNG
jgi:hypothetical protein